MDVACFCGCRFSCAGNLGTCPGGEYVSLSRVSDADEKQMRAELDLLLTHGAAAHRRRVPRAGGQATWSMSFPTSAEPALLAVASSAPRSNTCDERHRPTCKRGQPPDGGSLGRPTKPSIRNADRLSVGACCRGPGVRFP